MEAVGFQRRCSHFRWISFHSLAAVTFFIPYSLGKMAATLYIQHISDEWRSFERYIGLFTCQSPPSIPPSSSRLQVSRFPSSS